MCDEDRLSLTNSGGIAARAERQAHMDGDHSASQVQKSYANLSRWTLGHPPPHSHQAQSLRLAQGDWRSAGCYWTTKGDEMYVAFLVFVVAMTRR